MENELIKMVMLYQISANMSSWGVGGLEKD